MKLFTVRKDKKKNRSSEEGEDEEEAELKDPLPQKLQSALVGL